MKKSVINIGLKALSFSALSLIHPIASAKSININPLMTGMNSSYLGLEDAALTDQPFSKRRTPGRMYFYSTYHFEHEPWVLLNEDRSQKVEPIVSSLHTLDLGFSWLLGDNMQLSLQTFGSKVGVAPRFGGEDNLHAGDSRVQLKYRFYTSAFWNMAIAPELTIPTGVEYVGHRYGASLSNSSFAPGAKFIGEYRTSENQWTFNLGYTYYDKAEFKFPLYNYPRVDGRSRVFLGTGWLSRLSKQWAFDSEFSAQIPTGPNAFTSPGLATLGLRYQPENTISWHFGAGSGSLGTPGGNDVVLYAGIKVPFFGGKANEVGPGNFDDPLVEEAYRKNLSNNADDPTKMNRNDLDHLFNLNPVDQDTGKPLYTQEELTKKVIYKKEKIQVLDEVEFDLNMSHLTPRGKQIVQQVARVILANKDAIRQVNVGGHTDHLGNPSINDPLSQARAVAVANELAAMGVPASILSAQGYGANRPLYDSRKNPRYLWEKNRRVEFNIVQSE